jgi:hypothetical protein
MIGIVTTTIFDMTALDGYAESIVTHGRDQRVQFYLIPDKKTAPSLMQRVEAARSKGLRVVYPSLDEQDRFLQHIGLGVEFVPYNTDNRRNVGYLMALADGAEMIISIDDDNFCDPRGDFVGQHVAALTGRSETSCSLSSDTGWANVMEFLDYEPDVEAWARGFPYYAKGPVHYQMEPASAGDPVAVHAGLWTRDPDVDAVTRLALSPLVRAAKQETVTWLSRQTWMPINTQNTSLTREAMQAYYYIRMGYPFGDLRLDRFGDILSGYFVQACAKAGGEVVSFGSPIVDHRRTKHDLLKDLGQEYFGILLMEEILPWLTELKLTGTTYAERYRDLAYAMERFAATHSGGRWRPEMGAFLAETAHLMADWAAAVERL